MQILDTDVLIDIQHGFTPATDWLSHLDEIPFVPGFVVMELIQGAQNKQQIRQVQKLVAPLPMIWPSSTDCERALSLFATYHLSHSLGLIEAMIASMVLGRNATLCTFNRKHYQAIAELAIFQPYKRS